MRLRKERGASVLEVVAVMAIAAVISGIAVFNYRAVEDASQNGASMIAGFVKKARSKALASTLSYRVTTDGDSRLVASYSSSCSSGSWTDDPALTLELPTLASMTNTGWTICFDSRGISSSSQNIGIADAHSTNVVQVVMGGGVRVQ